MIRAGLFLGAAAVGLTLAGCANTSVNTVRPEEPATAPIREHLSRITMNPELDRRARVASVFLDNQNGLLKVQANVRSETGAPGWIQYHFDWFDGRGMVIEGPASGTARTRLLPGELVNLVGLAPTEQAVDWRLTIRGL